MPACPLLSILLAGQLQNPLRSCVIRIKFNDPLQQVYALFWLALIKQYQRKPAHRVRILRKVAQSRNEHIVGIVNPLLPLRPGHEFIEHDASGLNGLISQHSVVPRQRVNMAGRIRCQHFPKCPRRWQPHIAGS